MIPAAVLGWRTLAIQRAGLESAERQLQVSVIDHVSTLLGRTMDDASEASHRVGRILTEASITADDARENLAREAMARCDALAAVVIYDKAGVLLDAMVRRGSSLDTAPVKQLEPEALAAPSSGRWLTASFEAGRPVIRYVEPVERDGQRRAFVVGVMAVPAIADQLVGISRDRFEGRADGVLIVDEGGRIVVGGGALATGESLAGRDVLGRLNPPSGSFAHEYGAATEFVDAAGTPMVGSLRSIPSRRWAVIVRRPQAAVYLALGRARTALATALSLIVAVAVGLGVALAARITRPVRRLQALARSYGEGKLELRSDVRSGDELEDLGESMSQMAGSIASQQIEIARRATVEDRLSRFLPGEVARDISSGRGHIMLGGERREISVLFADVVAFTPFAESAPPEHAVAFLNELFTVLSEVVFRHGGTIDKFIGDSIMAIFGAPRAQEDHVERALGAAEDMQRFVEASAPAWKEKYGFEVRIGIGVATGQALVGNLGSESRMEYTAIGDIVNVAARLEALARPGQTLVTGDVATRSRELGDAYQFHDLGPQPLRGKKKPVEVLEVA